MISTLFLSNILNMPIKDKVDNIVGKIKDIAVLLEKYPLVTKIIVKPGNIIIPWEFIQYYDAILFRLSIKKDELKESQLEKNEILLRKNLLDMQLFDIQGKKIVRVNDIQLSQINNELRMVSADIGLRGILRRLDLEHLFEKIANLFGIKIPDNYISSEFLSPVNFNKKDIYLTIPAKDLANVHPVDIAEMISELAPKERTSVIEILEDEIAADVISELDDDMKIDLINSLNDNKVADILEEMNPDEAVDILQDIPTEQTERYLNLMDKEDAEDLRELMAFEEDEAGGLMNSDFISFSPELTVEQTINWIRENKPSTDTIYYIYITDENEHLIGVVSLRGLIIAEPDTKLKYLMNRNVIKVNLHTHKTEIAKLMVKYNFLAIPVVDENNVIQGIVTLEDALDLEEELVNV